MRPAGGPFTSYKLIERIVPPHQQHTHIDNVIHRFNKYCFCHAFESEFWVSFGIWFLACSFHRHIFHSHKQHLVILIRKACNVCVWVSHRTDQFGSSLACHDMCVIVHFYFLDPQFPLPSLPNRLKTQQSILKYFSPSDRIRSCSCLRYVHVRCLSTRSNRSKAPKYIEVITCTSCIAGRLLLKWAFNGNPAEQYTNVQTKRRSTRPFTPNRATTVW